MLVQRTMQQSLRRCAFQQPSALTRTAISKFSPPAIIAISNQCAQRRHAATQQVSQDEGYDILVKQRLQRPVAPHLTIYKPQIQMMTSAFNRITGCIVSGTFYVFGVSYLVAPLFGWHLESTTMAAAFGSLPFAAKALIKFGFALPFTFHCLNGTRHLVWDTARGFAHKQFVRSSWVIVGLSFLSAGYLAYL